MKKRKKRRFIRSGKFWVYIVECADKTYYTGYTNDLQRRIDEHNNSKQGAKYTRSKRPVSLVYTKKCECFELAMKEEYRIKNLRRWQKEELIKGGDG